MHHFSFVAVLFIAFIGSGSVFAASGDAVETTLYFGLDGGAVSEAQWAGFTQAQVSVVE